MNINRVGRILMFLLVGAMLGAGEAGAKGIQTLVMPGEVIRGHAKYEENCEKCHGFFSKIPQRELCLDCHKEVASDIRDKKGFHGKNGEVGKNECRKCHPDHRGRSANITNLNKDIFDHSLTDFALEGSHAKVSCDGCHDKGRKYRDAPSVCVKCHERKDPHDKKLGEKCEKCHNEESWSRFKFDHEKTKFPLVGKHTKTSCVSCHPGQRYRGIGTECVTCHFLVNVHGKRYGGKCEKCHTPKDWKVPYYDHKKSKFKLVGKHKKVSCELCHRDKSYREKLETDCYSCHRFHDVHKGKFGKKCEECHSPDGWKKVRFDHSKGVFPLKGKHKKLECGRCHRGRIEKRKAKGKVRCVKCHGRDDVHDFGKKKLCSDCHIEKGWNESVRFDHDMTSFPLVGLHAVVACESCHGEKLSEKTPRRCSFCHAGDDKHRGRLGEKCQSCHNPNGWELWEFNHDKQTRYPLTGAHRDLYCELCHTEPVRGKIMLPRECSECHLEDDVHRGKFGAYCNWCHVTDSFKKLKDVIGIDRQ